MDKATCTQCGHTLHAFALGPDGRCGSCVLEEAREAAHVQEAQAAAPAPWAAIRAQRATMLAACDWTQLPDVPSATRAAWADYRQALRDITDQPNPGQIVWPTPPQE